jgi:3-dehydroquinate synthase
VTRSIGVAVGDRPYDVLIGRGLISETGARLAPRLERPFAPIVTDEIVASLWLEPLAASLAAAGIAAPTIVLPAGEQTKSFDGLAGLCDRLLNLEVERTDHVIALGGGVIGDLTGFAAAIIKRGVDFVQIPTTLLAQVDSSVGGKTAIDTPQGKNLVGAFHQPRLVLADLAALETLPRRELACGYAEVVKYGLLGDAGFFAWLETNGAAVLAGEAGAVEAAVARCVEMKAQIVAEDERENGARALLNLGHTFGHAVEALNGFGEAVKHGEAVGLGCVLAFEFSQALGLCDAHDVERTRAAVGAAGLPVRLSQVFAAPPQAEALIAAMAHDKKAIGGALSFVLARGIGEAFVRKGVAREPLRDFLIGVGAAP